MFGVVQDLIPFPTHVQRYYKLTTLGKSSINNTAIVDSNGIRRQDGSANLPASTIDTLDRHIPCQTGKIGGDDSVSLMGAK